MKKTVLALALILLATASFLPSSGAAPNDPLLNRQWNWTKVGADRAYDAGLLGEGVTVAVLDTGIDTNHPDLRQMVIAPCTSPPQHNCSKNFTNEGAFNDIGDNDGHGTMVSGIIAAIANNGVGIAGVAPRVKIMMLKVLTQEGGSSFNVDQAILFALDSGVRVISMSLGGQSSPFSRLLDRLALDSAQRRDAIVIAAAGNDGSNVLVYPAAYSQTYDNVFAVAALDKNNQKASFSNYGPHITFIAPGVEIISTYPTELTPPERQPYGFGSGTSFAAPHVAAAAALLLSKSPGLTSADVKRILCSQSINLGLSREFQGCGLIYVGNLAQSQIVTSTTTSSTTTSTTMSTTSGPPTITNPFPGQALALVDVSPSDLQGNPKSSFAVGSQSQFKVTVNNASPNHVTATLTVNVYDSTRHTLGVVYVQRAFSPGTTIVILSLSIPGASSRGLAAAYINLLDRLNGAPLTFEKSTVIQIG